MAININSPIKYQAQDNNENYLPDINLNYGPYSSKETAVSTIISNYGSASLVPLGVKFAVVSSGTLTEYQWKSGATFNASNCTEIGASSGGGTADSVAWANVTSKPTTLAGYGITDAFSGSYNDLTDKPTIPTKTSDLTNDSGFVTGTSFATITNQLNTITEDLYEDAEVEDWGYTDFSLDDFEEHNAAIDPGAVWSYPGNTYTHIVIPVTTGDKFKLSTIGLDHYSWYSFLASYSIPTAKLQPAYLANGATEIIKLPANNFVELEATGDATYLYLQYKSAGNSILPNVQKFAKVSVSREVSKLVRIEDSIDNIESKLQARESLDISSYTEQQLHIDGASSKPSGYRWYTTMNVYKGIVIPCSPGSSYEIKANASASSYYAFVKSIGVHDDNVEFGTGCTRTTISAGTTINAKCPSDAHYLWVSTLLSSTVTTPQSIKVTSAFVESVVDTVKETSFVNTHNFRGDDLADLESFTVTVNSKRPFNIMHLSDIHTHTVASPNDKCFRNAIWLSENPLIDVVCLTGDYVWDDFASPIEPFEDAMSTLNKDVVLCVGNHDVGQSHSGTSAIAASGSDNQVYERFIEPYLTDSCMYDADTTLTAHNASLTDKFNSYYVDYASQKVRIISLYQYNNDMDSNDDVNLTYPREVVAYRQSQIDWFVDTLNDTPANYAIFVLTHEPEGLAAKTDAWQSISIANKNNDNIIIAILTAYKKRQSLTYTRQQTHGVVANIEVSADFTNAVGFIAGWLNGHYHDDFVGKSYNGEINIFNKNADNMDYQTGSSIKKTLNTANENSINIISVDTELKTITVKKVGAKFSRNGDYRNVCTLSY